jgi:hypothetical protein
VSAIGTASAIDSATGMTKCELLFWKRCKLETRV